MLKWVKGCWIAAFALLVISLQGLVFTSPANSVSPNPSPTCTTACVISFTYTGDTYTWNVPAGVSSISFEVRGAAGGDGKYGSTVNSYGGQGGITTGNLEVTPGQLLILKVGGRGANGNAVSGGFNGGGATNASSSGIPGSGGGASDIRLTTDTLAARVVVAGGGGGASGFCGSGSSGNGGAGGGSTGEGGGGNTGCWNSARGGGGTQSAGGAALGINYSVAGSLGNGGAGKGWSDGGGGGGGGYYGGGGATVGAGGGGSSYVHPTIVTGSTLNRGGQSGDGVITLTYQLPQPTTTSISIAGGATVLSKGRNVDIQITTTSTPGKVTAILNGKRMAGCINRVTSGSVTCSFKPTIKGSFSINVSFTPFSASYTPSVANISISVVTRTGFR